MSLIAYSVNKTAIPDKKIHIYAKNIPDPKKTTLQMNLVANFYFVVCLSGVYSSFLQSGGISEFVANETQLPSRSIGDNSTIVVLETCELVCKNVQEKSNMGGWRLACAKEGKRANGEILWRACKTGLQSVVERCQNTCASSLSEHWELEGWNPGYGTLDGCASSSAQLSVPQARKACLRGLRAGIKMVNQAIDAFLEINSIGHRHRSLEEKNDNSWPARSDERSKLKFVKRGQGCKTCSAGQ